MPLPIANSPQTSESANEVKARHAASPQYRTQRRFDRAARLVGESTLERLMNARAVVIGVGGVRSFTAESLVRSGVGRVDLVDYDKVCVTNSNRQLHAMKGTIGKNKVEVMAERLRLISPSATIEPVTEFYSEAASERILDGEIDFVVDAIDNITAKTHLIATCLERGIPLVSSMGAAARLDPTCIRTDDLALTRGDRFARAVRKLLRKNHGVQATSGTPIGVTAVYSTEPAREPIPPSYDEGVGFVCVCPGGKNGLNDCDKRNRIDGSASFVTGAFGLAAASVVVRSFMDAS